MKIKMRRATSDDWGDIRMLIRMFPKQLMQKNLPKAKSFFVAIVDDKVVGCCAMQVHSGRLGEIRTLAVHSDFQGKGIGKKLILECVKRAKRERVSLLLSITGQYNMFTKLGFGTFQKEKYAMFMRI